MPARVHAGVAGMTQMSRRNLLGGAAALATLALTSVTGVAAARTPVVRTTHGRVRGIVHDGVATFRGVRYGADTGPRRFQAPLPPTAWDGIREAWGQGPAAPQVGIGDAASEDCLFLNVWSPGCDEHARRPVLVYIHGGAYSSGTSGDPLCDGTQLAARGDVVVVSLNHRLNAFGYLYLARLAGGEAFPDSGNAGQLDLVLALTWVRDNVAAFGGDPRNVTLFGHSGGGAKIATLMAMPAAAGLFHRTWTMSGQQVTASGPLNATTRAHSLLASPTLSKLRVEDLRSIPAAQLVEALHATDPIIGRGRLYFGPVLDERTLTRHPFYPDAPPQSAHLPMVIGNTRGETRNLIGRGDPTTFELTWAELADRMSGELRADIHPDLVVATYRRLYPHYSPGDVFFAATTAARSWRGAVIELEARAAQPAGTWAYQLDWPSPADGGRWGAFHGLDIPLVFGTTGAEGALTGNGEDAKAMSRAMCDALLAFARTGDPNHPGLPEWRPYGLDRRSTLVLDVPPRVEDDPRSEERRLFAKVPFNQQGT
jgi:para-nitrobenzyl esterase